MYVEIKTKGTVQHALILPLTYIRGGYIASLYEFSVIMLYINPSVHSIELFKVENKDLVQKFADFHEWSRGGVGHS